jgi:RNA polymerase sigma-70 factor (ECF subfamily)
MQYFKQLNDAQLVQLFSAGQENAITTLVHRHKKAIFGSIFYLVKDRFLAEDIFQETFIKIIDTLREKKYAEEGKFLPWAMRIAHNLCIDHFRKVKRTPSITTQNNEDIMQCIDVTQNDAVEKLDYTQSTARVAKLIDLLPYDQKEVLVLRLFANLNFREIAEITKCSINTTLSRMRYSLVNLRKIMDEKSMPQKVA